MYKTIIYFCFNCGCELRIHFHNDKIVFYYLEHPIALKDIKSRKGYYKCPECKEISKTLLLYQI